MQADISRLEKICSQVRRDIVRMVHAVQSGHPGGSLGCTEYFVSLFFHIMKHNPSNFSMDGIHEDLFFLSNGHISPVYYSVLARSGYFEVYELASFRRLNSRLQGHPATHSHLEGIRIASGSLGQGLSVAAGAALAKKLNKDPQLVYVLMGDGELNEGQIWEAAMYASHNQIDNLIATVDWNGQQIDGPTDKVLGMGDLAQKFQAFGWETITVENGNQVQEIIKGLELAKEKSGKSKPVVVLMKTVMGQGVSFMAGTHKWHGVAPNDEQLQIALSELPETLGDY